jgi:hypothetical protein
MFDMAGFGATTRNAAHQYGLTGFDDLVAAETPMMTLSPVCSVVALPGGAGALHRNRSV